MVKKKVLFYPKHPWDEMGKNQWVMDGGNMRIWLKGHYQTRFLKENVS